MSDDQALESVHRVISLLRTLPLFNGKWFGVKQVAEKWGMPGSTTHRFLRALVAEGIVEYSEELRKYKVKR
jgi:DNA-binding IclR family transcriptional regulator